MGEGTGREWKLIKKGVSLGEDILLLFTQNMIFSRLKSNHGSKIAALIYGALIIIILLLAYTGNLPPILNKIPYYDTFGHLILYGLASYLGHLAFKHRRISLMSRLT